MGILLIVIIFISVVVVMISRRITALKSADMSPAELQRYVAERRASLLTFEHGPLNPALMCPYCRKKGNIRTKRVERKKRVSGATATGTILIGGVSIVASDLSRKEQVTEVYCGNCEGTWEF